MKDELSLKESFSGSTNWFKDPTLKLALYSLGCGVFYLPFTYTWDCVCIKFSVELCVYVCEYGYVIYSIGLARIDFPRSITD